MKLGLSSQMKLMVIAMKLRYMAVELNILEAVV